MKVIVDNKIPYIREVIEQLADEVVYLPGKAFTPEVVKDADALIIRTRTICNRELLEGSNVRIQMKLIISNARQNLQCCWSNRKICHWLLTS